MSTRRRRTCVSFLTSRLIVHSRGLQLPDFVAASRSCARALENHSGFGFVSSDAQEDAEVTIHTTRNKYDSR